jgi:hypothetical protein
MESYIGTTPSAKASVKATRVNLAKRITMEFVGAFLNDAWVIWWTIAAVALILVGCWMAAQMGQVGGAILALPVGLFIWFTLGRHGEK